jgi:hypothetical protein
MSVPYLPADIASCQGDGSLEDGEQHWREGCKDCLRRTAPGGREPLALPPIIAFECAYRFAPGELQAPS